MGRRTLLSSTQLLPTRGLKECATEQGRNELESGYSTRKLVGTLSWTLIRICEWGLFFYHTGNREELNYDIN